MEGNGRLLIIGLDGATWTVLEPWLKDGSLPNLAKLRTNGCWGELRSTFPPLTAPAWSSFLTGKNPAKHGVFHFLDLDDDPDQPKTGLPKIVDGRSIQSATLWDVIGHLGGRVGVINVPMSYPPRPISGFVVTCLLTPPQAPFTYPPELAQRLDNYQIDLDRFIDQKPFARDEQGHKQKRIVKPDLQLVAEFDTMEEQRARAALSLMASEPWDAFMVVFTATDRMGHYLWPWHRAVDLDGTVEGDSLHEAIRCLYQRLDEHIGALVAEAGPNTSVIIMSDHGMGPAYTKNTHWNNWLYKRGCVQINQKSTQTPDGWLLRLGISRDKLRRLARRVPGLTSSRLMQRAKAAPTVSIDFARSKAYYVPLYNPVGGIRINAQGEERAVLGEALMKAVQEVVDPETGKPIVRSVFWREAYYTGPYADQMPDLILVMHPEYGSSDRLSNYSTIATERPSLSDPGAHHIEGIFVAHGPAIAAIQQPLPDLIIEDMAPTALHLLGLPVPDDMDGRVLTEILTPAWQAEHPVVKMKPVGRWPSDAAAMPVEAVSPEEDEVVVDRLRALGYLG
ncbi:MAG: alkaline phosphatase family protein [Chloroflexi bacterium]|nr:alkaline phosphatase family protein [Chloroflexota bacterium]